MMFRIYKDDIVNAVANIYNGSKRVKKCLYSDHIIITADKDANTVTLRGFTKSLQSSIEIVLSADVLESGIEMVLGKDLNTMVSGLYKMAFVKFSSCVTKSDHFIKLYDENRPEEWVYLSVRDSWSNPENFFKITTDDSTLVGKVMGMDIWDNGKFVEPSILPISRAVNVYETLCAVSVSFKNTGVVEWVATNRKSLSVSTTGWWLPPVEKVEKQISIWGELMTKIRKMANGGTTIYLYREANENGDKICIKFDNVTIKSSMSVQKFPNVQMCIPQWSKCVMYLSTADLLRYVKDTKSPTFGIEVRSDEIRFVGDAQFTGMMDVGSIAFGEKLNCHLYTLDTKRVRKLVEAFKHKNMDKKIKVSFADDGTAVMFGNYVNETFHMITVEK